MRNPYPVFYLSQETARDKWEEGGDDTKSAWPFDTLGRTRDTMEPTEGLLSRKAELIPSNGSPVQIEVCNSTS